MIMNQTHVCETENFQNWFQKSKVIDKQKKPLLVYHGTIHDISIFNTEPEKRGFYGIGESAIGAHFSEDKEIASCYPFHTKYHEKRKVMEVYVRVQNPKKYTTILALRKDVMAFCEEHKLLIHIPSQRLDNVKRFKQHLIEQGYDGITYLEGPPSNITKNKKRVWVTFYPQQIKSPNNNGSFDVNNTNIYY